MRALVWLCALALVGCAVTPPLPSSPPSPSRSAPASATPSGSATPQPTTSSGKPSPSPDWKKGRGIAGVDVSAYQPRVDWQRLAATGHRFVWIKASEGSGWTNQYFPRQRSGARSAGLLQGAYHYARPASSSGATQARHFLSAGGRWRPDGRTLPGALDLEFAQTGDRCHGLTVQQLRDWIREFSDTYAHEVGPAVLIYTSAEFWAACTGGDDSFGQTNRLWLFDHAARPGKLPKGWTSPTVWQRGVTDGIDRNVFFGTEDELQALARMG